MERISVIGTSGSGKSTIARQLSLSLDIPLLELDSVFHQPGWTPLPDDEFRAKVEEFTRRDSWVIDGNYTSHGVADVVWPRADTVVWLDLPRPTVMRRVIVRTFRRVFTREELWNGNREPLTNLYSPDPEKNIMIWAFTRHRPNQKKYEMRAEDESWSHAEVFRLTTLAEVDEFIGEVATPRIS